MTKMNAIVYKDRSQTEEEHVSQLPEITDTPGIERKIFGKKDISRAPKSYEKVKTTHQANRDETNPHKKPQRKNAPYGIPGPLAERLSWDEQRKPTDEKNPNNRNIH